MLPRMRITSTIPSSYSDKEKKIMRIIFESLSIATPSVHFSLNSIAESHGEHQGFDDNSFIIIDKFLNSKEQIVGGYIEDLFCIGCFRLSDEATILVPKWRENPFSLEEKIQFFTQTEKTKYRKDYNSFQEKLKRLPDKIKIIYFDTSIKDALQHFLASQDSDYMRLVPREEESIPAFFGQVLSKKVSSQEIIHLIKGVFCNFEITPMAQIKQLLCGTEMKPCHPYLETLKHNTLSSQINEYISSISSVFPLNDNSELFIKQYLKAINNLIDFLTKTASKEFEKFEDNWFYYKELITQYDQIDTEYQIQETRATKVLTSKTGLFFSPYIRNKDGTIVDAVHKVSQQTDKEQCSAEELRKRFNINNFFNLKVKDQRYIVFPEVNLPENYKLLGKF